MGSWRFPEVKFVHKNNMYIQLGHVVSEANEVKNAINLHEPIERIDEEAADVLHSAETYFRIRQLEGADIHKIFSQVVEKNLKRGYYNFDLCKANCKECPGIDVKPEANGEYICNHTGKRLLNNGYCFTEKYASDRYRERIIQRLDGQRAKGLKKYGQTLEFNTADMLERIEHLQQELTDGLEYCEWIKEAVIGHRKLAETALISEERWPNKPYRCYCCGKETTTAISLCGTQYFMCDGCLLDHVQANAKAVEEAKRQMEGRK